MLLDYNGMNKVLFFLNTKYMRSYVLTRAAIAGAYLR